LKLLKIHTILFLLTALIVLNSCSSASNNSAQSASDSKPTPDSVQTETLGAASETDAADEAAVTGEGTAPPPEAWMNDFTGLEILDDEGNEIARCSDSKEAQDKLNHFQQALIKQVNADLQTELRIGEAEAEDIIFNRHTRIFSTMNQNMQKIMDRVIMDAAYYPEELDPDLQTAMVIIDYHTGQVKAMSGGRDCDNTEINRATDIIRQPGSSFQILAAYAPAMDMGLIDTDSIVVDEPFTIDGWQPLNWWGNSYKGEMTVRQAVAHSANVIAVKTGVDAGIDKCFDYVQKFHFTTIVDSKTIDGTTYTDRNAAMMLGGLTYGVRLLELTSAYSAIANDGDYISPSFYTRVCNNDGKVLLLANPLSQQVLKKETANGLTDLMCGVVSEQTGTGRKAAFNELNIPVAGKTGSTTYDQDLSFIGYTPYYAAGIWSGYDEITEEETMSEMLEKGVMSSVRPILTVHQYYILDIWRDVMEEIHKEQNLREKSFPFPITRIP